MIVVNGKLRHYFLPDTLFPQTIVLFIFLSASVVASPASSPACNWQVIGRAHITHSSDISTIPMHEKDKNIVWKNIKLHALKGNLKIRAIKLLMNDNQTIMLPIQKQIKAGHSSRIFSLPDQSRTIKKVTLLYQPPGDHSVDIVLEAEDGRH